MSTKIDNRAPIGSLLKKPGMYSHKIRETFRTPREKDAKHLIAIRQCMCVNCGTDDTIDAAHIRKASASHGKRSTGTGERPDDKWTVPLCKKCHKRQHDIGELTFWYDANVSPFLLAVKLYELSPNIRRMRETIVRAWNDDSEAE